MFRNEKHPDWLHNIKYGAMVLTAIIIAVLVWQAIELSDLNNTLSGTKLQLQQTNQKLDNLSTQVQSAKKLFGGP